MKLGHKFDDLHHVLSTHVEYFEYLGQVLLQEKSWEKNTSKTATYPQRNTCAHLCTWLPRSRYWQAKWWTPEVKIEEKKHPGGGTRMIISSQIDSHPNKTVKKRYSPIRIPKKHGDSNSNFIMALETSANFFSFSAGFDDHSSESKWCKWIGVALLKADTSSSSSLYIFGSRGLYIYLNILATQGAWFEIFLGNWKMRLMLLTPWDLECLERRIRSERKHKPF